MTQMAALDRVRCGLPRSLAERYRAEIEATGLGPVEIRRDPNGANLDCILDVRFGPFRRIAATAAEVQALLEERHARFF